MLTLALSFVLVALSNCLATAGDGGATVEEVETDLTANILEQWEDRIGDLEENMKKLQDENKYLKTKLFKTCHELKTSPYNESGFYWLDPDVSGKPIQLYCDMEDGVTQVGHNHEMSQNVTWCKGEGCYSLELEYTVPDAKIEALISMSEHCEQEILFQCKMAPLKNTAFGQFYYGWWVDSQGDKQFYFDGDNKDEHVCGCYNDKSCPLSSFNSSCHCDSSIMPLWNSDSGKITDKSSLPIRQFKYGSFFSEHQAAKISIGKLKCSGKTDPKPQLTSTCASLKKGGLTVDGFYLLKDGPEDNLKPGFCALSKIGYSEQDLRIESEDKFFSRKTTFNITSFKCTDCQPCTTSYDRHLRKTNNNECQEYHWISDLSVTQEDSHEISVDLVEGAFLIKTEGLYILFFEKTSFQLFIGDKEIFGKWSVLLQWIKKDEQIRFKTTYTNKEEPFGSFAIQEIVV